MKTIFRSIIFYSFSLYLVSELFSGLKISGGLFSIFTGGLALAAASLFLRPLLQIIAFPINLITLGLFSFFINAFLLYLVTRFIHSISVRPFTLHSFTYQHIVFPKVPMNIYVTFIFLSFVLSCVVSVLTWLTTD